MSCTFDLEHYRELLAAIRAGGYRFATFDQDPQPGDLFMRHDVDLSLEAAVELAELEAAEGIGTTYFLMTESVFYNLASPLGTETVERIRGLGHRIGLHADYPRTELDDRFDPLVSWHNPDPEYLSVQLDDITNVMEPRFFDQEHYRSDSNQRWRHGCPHEQIARGEFDWLHLLVHPAIWAFPGATMRETMLAMLDADRERRLDYLAEDRIDLS